MPKILIPKGQWTVIGPTLSKSLLQNQTPRPIYINEEQPENSVEGFVLNPWEKVEVGVGVTLNLMSVDSDANIFVLPLDAIVEEEEEEEPVVE